MDKRAPAPLVPTLVADALRAARDLGLGVGAAARARKGTREEIRIEIRHGGQRIAYTVEAKRALTPATLGAALHELAQLKPPALLVADYVTPPMAERLREAGVEFLDGAGNAYLNQPPLLVWVKGQRPAEKLVAPEVGRAFQPGGLQVLFALLGDPAALNLPYRELARPMPACCGRVCWPAATMSRRSTAGRSGRSPSMARCGAASRPRRSPPVICGRAS